MNTEILQSEIHGGGVFRLESNRLIGRTSPPVQYTPPSLTIQRSGKLLYQLNSGLITSEVGLQCSGPSPDRRLRFEGGEANNFPRYVSSIIDTFDAVRAIKLAWRDLEHPDGAARIFAVEPTLTGLWNGVRLQGGARKGTSGLPTPPGQLPVIKEPTFAVVAIDCTYANKFVYGMGGGQEFFLAWAIPTRFDGNVQEPDAKRILGEFILVVNNASQGRTLFVRDGLEVDGSGPGDVVFSPIEYDIRTNYSDFINNGNLVEVQLLHKGNARALGANEVIFLGALTGFSLIPVRPK